MLVLGIKRNEIIAIGKDIELEIWRDSKGGLRLGVSAPKHIPVTRLPSKPNHNLKPSDFQDQ